MGIRRWRRRLGRLLLAFALLYALAYAFTAAVDLGWPRADPEPVGQATIICLGGGPSPNSANRAARCAELYLSSPGARLVLSGGGQADVMVNAALRVGVDEADLILERGSRSTFQNALFSGRLLGDLSGPVVVVSDAFHLPRAWISFRLMGYGDVSLIATDETANWPRWYRREPLAAGFNLLRHTAWRLAFWLPEPTRDALLV